MFSSTPYGGVKQKLIKDEGYRVQPLRKAVEFPSNSRLNQGTFSKGKIFFQPQKFFSNHSTRHYLNVKTAHREEERNQGSCVSYRSCTTNFPLHSLLIRSCSCAHAVEHFGFPSHPSSTDEIWYIESLKEGRTMTK